VDPFQIKEANLLPEEIPLEILYDDKDFLVVNKPAGMVVHPGSGNSEHTLVNALVYHFEELRQKQENIRPGIVHRLDKDTSGVILVAKTDFAHNKFSKQFKKHEIEKVYHTCVKGIVEHEEGICEEPVGRAFLNRKKMVIRPSGGKEAYTFFKVLKRFRKTTYLAVFPKTGRTHQIRVHLNYIGHPLLGDALYGVKSPFIKRQALHAYSLKFKHPRTGQEIEVEAPIPNDMKELLSSLESGV